MISRGIRNNNPLNIRKTNISWRGKKMDGKDPDFEQFDTMYNGIRAALVNIRTMVRVHGRWPMWRMVGHSATASSPKPSL